MKDVHNASETRAKSAVLSNKYGNPSSVEKRKTKTGKVDYHRLKVCPYDFCNVTRLRIGPRLVEKHNLTIGTADYQTQLKLSHRKAKLTKNLVRKLMY